MNATMHEIFDIRSSVWDETGTDYVRRDGSTDDCVREVLFQARSVVIVGYGKLGRPTAINLKNAFSKNSLSANVSVALRRGSKSVEIARKDGFCSSEIGSIEELVPEADVVFLLVDDFTQCIIWRHVTNLMGVGSTLCLCNGNLLAHNEKLNAEIRPYLNVAMISPLCPALALMNNAQNCNFSVSVYRDVSGNTENVATALAFASGAKTVFLTESRLEYQANLIGLCGASLTAPVTLIEAIFERLTTLGVPSHEAFLISNKGLCQIIRQEILRHGFFGFYCRLDDPHKKQFEDGFNSMFPVANSTLISLSRLIGSHGFIGRPVQNLPVSELLSDDVTTNFSSVVGSMWRVDSEYYAENACMSMRVAHLAGLYSAVVVAETRFLHGYKFRVDQIMNSSVIYALNYLMPCLDRRGFGWTFDSLNRPARLAFVASREAWWKAFCEVLSDNHETNRDAFKFFVDMCTNARFTQFIKVHAHDSFRLN